MKSQKPETGLLIEISCVYSGVINGDLFLDDGRRAGTVQFHCDKPGRRAIRRLRAAGIPVKFPLHVRPARKPQKKS